MIFEFGEIKGQLVILLIYPIGIILARYTNLYYQNNPYFYLFLFYISHFLVLIPLLIYKLIDKINNKEKNNNNYTINFEDEKSIKIRPKSFTIKNQIEDLSTEIKTIKSKEKYLSLSLIAILYFLTYGFFYYINFITTTSFYGNISMVMELLYFSLLNRIILGNKLYAHHFFSIVLITISITGLYLLLIAKFIQNNTDWEVWRDFIFPTILNFIVYFFFCFYLIKCKYYIEKYFISPYELIIFLGIFCLILLLILEPITFFIKCKNAVMCHEGHFAGIISGFKLVNNTKAILIVLSWVIFLFMTCFGLWFTVKFLSPSHFLTSDSLITLGLNILLDCFRPNYILLNNPLFYIFSIITIFGCLVYNEIIILRICNLNYNTRKEIIKRQKEEDIYIDDKEADLIDEKNGSDLTYEKNENDLTDEKNGSDLNDEKNEKSTHSDL